MALITSVNFARSVVKAQVAVVELELLVVADIAVELVPVTVTALLAVFEIAVPVVVTATVAALVTVTLMIAQRRESSPILMIKPAGFLMTKLPR